MEVETGAGAEKEEAKKDDGPSVLDLAFAMDCTGSMGSYINQARQVRQQHSDFFLCVS